MKHFRIHFSSMWIRVGALMPGIVLVAADPLGIGLYRDGQLIEQIELSSAVPGGSLENQHRVRSATDGFEQSVTQENHDRTRIMNRYAELGVRLRLYISGEQIDRDELRRLVSEFLAAGDAGLAHLERLTEHLMDRGLPAEIVERQLAAVESFAAELSRARRVLTGWLAGTGPTREMAMRVLATFRYRESSRPIKAPEWRAAMQEAPRLTEAEADARVMFWDTATAFSSASGSPPASASAHSSPAPEDLAETVEVQFTAGILSRASALGNDPLAIYEFVRNEVVFEPYVGSRKGADFTLSQRSGNDTDQASLLLALLRSAGIPSRYVTGTVELTPEQATSWLGVDHTATAGAVLTTAGLDGVNITDGPTVTAVRCTRVWVEAYVPYSNYRGANVDGTGSTWIPLDPAFHGTEISAGTDVLTPMGFNMTTFLAGYISAVNALSPVEQFEADVQTWLDANDPGTFLDEIRRVTEMDFLSLGLLPASLPYSVISSSPSFAALSGGDRYQLRFHLYDGGTGFIDHTVNLSDIAGKEILVSYVGATPTDVATIDSFGGVFNTPPNLVQVKPVLLVDGTAVATATNAIGLGYDHSFDMHFIAPAGASNVQPTVGNSIIAGNPSAIAFNTFLDTPSGDFDNPIAPTDGNVVESLLHPVAVDYLRRVDDGMRDAGGIMGVVTTQDVSEAILASSVSVAYSFGIPQTFEWTGLIVDADRRIVGTFPIDGDSSKNVPFMLLTGYEGSTMENRVFEDLFGQDAVSTIKILQLASDMGIGICEISTSIAVDCPGITQPVSVQSAINSALAQGHVVTVPEDPLTTGNWSGTGYIDLTPSTGAAGYIISGGISGELTIAGGATVQTWPIILTCAPEPGTLMAEVLNPAADCPAPASVFCADNTRVSFTLKLMYDCEDAPGQTMTVTRTTTQTKKQIADAFGAGDYYIQVLGAPAKPGKHPRKIRIFKIELDSVTPPDFIGTEAGGTRVYATAISGGNSTVQLKVVPAGTAVPPGTVTWTGGSAGADQLQRLVSNTALNEAGETVTANACGNEVFKGRIHTYRAKPAAALVTVDITQTRDDASASAFGLTKRGKAWDPTETYQYYYESKKFKFLFEEVAYEIIWGVKSGGRTDVPDALANPFPLGAGMAAGSTEAQKKTQAKADLTPAGIGRAPRTKYWSKSLTEKHEQFHMDDWEDNFYTPKAREAETWIEMQEVAVTLSKLDPTAVLTTKKPDFDAKLIEKTDEAQAAYNPDKETRAYGDGTAFYQTLADLIVP